MGSCPSEGHQIILAQQDEREQVMECSFLNDWELYLAAPLGEVQPLVRASHLGALCVRRRVRKECRVSWPQRTPARYREFWRIERLVLAN